MNLGQDVRFSLRQLARHPGFALVAVLTLALGIGANTALFTLAEAMFTRPLPGVEDSSALAWVGVVRPGYQSQEMSYPAFRAFRDQAQSFTSLAGYTRIALSLGSGGAPQRIRGQLVTGNFFDTLGVRMAAGRAFLPEEDRTPGSHPVVVISHALWQRRFASDPNLVGKEIILNGHGFTVVGIAPSRFTGCEFDDPADAWLPVMIHALAMPRPYDPLAATDITLLRAFARLRPDVSRGQAVTELTTLARQLQLDETSPEPAEPYRVEVSSMAGWVQPTSYGEAIPIAVLCFGVTGLVLLLTCANVTNLLLSRAAARRAEFGVRLAMGATRRRLAAQLLAESAPLAMVGAAGGVLFSLWATELVVVLVELPSALDLRPTPGVLAFTLTVAAGVTLALGLAPALYATRRDVALGLKDAAGVAGPGPRGMRAHRWLVASQIALATVLLVTTGLLLRTLQSISGVDLGFTGRENVLTVSFDLDLLGYDRARRDAFYRELLDRVRAFPETESVSVANNLPFSFTLIRTSVEAEAQAESGRYGPGAFFNLVHPDYFRVIGTPLRAGRDFTLGDDAGSPRVAIVNEAMAGALWPGQDAVGKRFHMGGDASVAYEVVGVAADGKYDNFADAPSAHVFLPAPQNPRGLEGMILLVRARGNAAGLIERVRQATHALEPNLALYRMQLLSEAVEAKAALRQQGAKLLGGFAGLALGLAALGVYGVMAFAVAQRKREIGIRVALGAQPGDVQRQFLRETLGIAASGVAVGGVLALVAASLLTDFFFGVSAADPLTYAAVGALLLVTALLASWLPARRATKVDPMVALRHE